MTNEEAIKWFRESPAYHKDHEPFNLAIKALEQQPCENAISRDAVEKITWEEPTYTDPLNVLTEVREKVRNLPPVTPIRPKDNVLDMIRAEIIEMRSKQNIGVLECLDIIDKYKADTRYAVKVVARGNCINCGKELTEGIFFCKECMKKAECEE